MRRDSLSMRHLRRNETEVLDTAGRARGQTSKTPQNSVASARPRLYAGGTFFCGTPVPLEQGDRLFTKWGWACDVSSISTPGSNMSDLSWTQGQGRDPSLDAPVRRDGAGSASRDRRTPSVEPLRVLLLDDAGAPVAGARVTLEARQVMSDDSLRLTQVRGLLEPLTELSSALGETVFHDLSAVTYRVAVQRDGFVGRASIEARPGDDLVIALRRGRKYTGTILDATTKAPVVGAVVRVAGVDWNKRELTRAVGESDASGHFEVQGIGDHALAVTIQAPWYPEFKREFPMGTDQTTFRMHAAPRAVFRRLVDEQTGEPVAGATVRTNTGSAVSAEDGRFLLTGVGLDEDTRYLEDGNALISVQASHPAYATRTGDVTVPAVIPAGESRTVNVKTVPMVPRETCTGRVDSAANVPVADALVLLVVPGSNLSQSSVLRETLRTRTRADGSFVLPAVPSDLGSLQLVVLADKHAPCVLDFDPQSARHMELHLDAGLDLDLAAPACASGNRQVILEECAHAPSGPRTTLRRRSEQADMQGRVTFYGVRAGAVRVIMPGGSTMELDVSARGAAALSVATRISG